ncbi:MAG: type VI secretion system baseplate subunit TssE [Alphaproteobacteria bacterium]|nr:type VI secretion system baseplate subunit TssE [Alphaproteobacteria bacterium]
MKKNKIQRGVLPPLFDRIIQRKMDQAVGEPLLDAKGLQESIIKELSLMLNTRCTVRKVIYDNHIDEIPLFGLPDFFGLEDFSDFDPSNQQTWPKTARIISSAIQAAEPRLQNIHVKIKGYNTSLQSLEIAVSAMIKEAKLLKEIHFPLELLRNLPGVGQAAA